MASILAIAAVGLCSLLDHAALVTGTPLAAGLAFLQLSLVGGLLFWRIPYRHKWWAAGLLCLMLALFCWRAVQPSLVAAAAVPHTIVYLGLLAVFGTSLLPGRDALVTALARHMHGPIRDDMAAYTRKLTWLWCGFFAAQLSASLLLLLFAPLATWSFFVNVLNLPLLVLMFVAEYALRGFGLRNPPRHGLAYMTGMAAFIREKMSKQPSG
jgi:uncharacterized membrane protein